MVPLSDYVVTKGEKKYDEEKANAKPEDLNEAKKEDDHKPIDNANTNSTSPMATIAEAPKEEPKPIDNSPAAQVEVAISDAKA